MGYEPVEGLLATKASTATRSWSLLAKLAEAPYIVMESIEGRTLGARPDATHAKGIFHRDHL